MRGSVGLVTLDMKFASMFKEASSKVGFKVIHVLSLDELPLSVKVVVTTEKEISKFAGNRTIVYAENYGSMEEILEKVMEIMLGIDIYKSVLIAIDPGKTVGVAYLVNDKIIKTSRYVYEEKMIDDLKSFLERHRDAGEKIIIIGSTTTIEESSRLLETLSKSLSKFEGLRMEIIDESRTAKGLIPKEKGVSRDEYSAILLSLRNKLKLRRVESNADTYS
ncbi:MAG: hypothetical protein NZ929_05035 [Aigarchaeota archaeon]|nr:hypothetical protein [Aigarchaeota archaeon]